MHTCTDDICVQQYVVLCMVECRFGKAYLTVSLKGCPISVFLGKFTKYC